MPRGVKKENLPSKICEVCKRPFTWRKVWERCWDDVKTCSDRCKAERKKQSKAKKEESSSNAKETSAENVSQVVNNGIWQDRRLSVAGMPDLQIPVHHFLLFSLCPHRFMASHKMQCP
ncbi:hypothetical protein KC19_5G022700 [Ceratodon purpureus]|uniref:DUF2256 domain-containing protein n=1 Tax=Ceratodon purpureus TaxID=3225 RepID=A0A8T0HYA9_CERPU|nr:hypothetical protein KC19_5G022700 [Ceratodon purpureus]